VVRLAERRSDREAARRVRARDRRREEKSARRADPGARVRDRHARPGGRVHRAARRAQDRDRLRHRPRQPLLEHQKELTEFILRRLLGTVPVLLVVAVLVFLLLRLTPGDPAAILAGDAASAENIAAIRAGLGLDRPLVVQFGIWMGNLLTGDLGQSYYYRMKVTALIAQRLEPTFALATLTILLSVLVSVPLGVLAAWRHGGWFDRALMGFSVMGFSIPVFVLAYLLIWLVSLQLGWLPVQGYVRMSENFPLVLKHLILPSITLSFIYVALIARVTRASVLEALGEDYIRTARAKGLTELRVVVRHALANAAVPIITVIGIGIAILIGGVVVTESVFAIPGLGRLTVDAVLARDFPTIQGVILFFSFVYVAVNLLVDLSYVVLDPRIRY
jgi:peptide/nickel transport system permease protein